MTFNSQGWQLKRQGEISAKTQHKVIGFKKEDTVIGRDESADVQITDIPKCQSISRKHFRILFDKDDMYIELVQGKKLLVNKEKLKDREKLKIGDVISFGSVSYKVSKPDCIEIDSDTDEDENEALDDPLTDIDEKSLEELTAGLEAGFEIDDTIQLISDDEDYEKAKTWTQKLLVKGKNENFSRSRDARVKIGKTSSQSSNNSQSSAVPDSFPTYNLEDIPPMLRLEVRLVELSIADIQRYTDDQSDEFDGSERSSNPSIASERTPSPSTRKNVARKKRNLRAKVVKKKHKQATAYERVQAVVDPDSEEDSDNNSISSSSTDSRPKSERKQRKRLEETTYELVQVPVDPDSEEDGDSRSSNDSRANFRGSGIMKQRKRQEDANNNNVSQKKRPSPGTIRNSTKRAPEPQRRNNKLTQLLAKDLSDESDRSNRSASKIPQRKRPTPGTTRNGTKRDILNSTLIKKRDKNNVAPIPTQKRRMSTSERDPTGSLSKRGRVTGAVVSGHWGKETAEDMFSKAQLLRDELEKKHQDALFEAAILPLSEQEKTQDKPFIKKGPRRRISTYIENTFAAVKSSASTSRTAEKASNAEPSSKDEINEKLRQLAEKEKQKKKPEILKKVESTKPKCKVTGYSRTAALVESLEESSNASSVKKLPPVSSLPRIPKKVVDPDEAKRQALTDVIDNDLKDFFDTYVSPKVPSPKKKIPVEVPKARGPANAGRILTSTGRSSTSASGCTTSTVSFNNEMPAIPATMGFYNPIELPPLNDPPPLEDIQPVPEDLQSCDDPPLVENPSLEIRPSEARSVRSCTELTVLPLIISSPTPNLTSILKNYPSEKKKSLRFAEELCQTKFFDLEDWDYVPPPKQLQPPQPPKTSRDVLNEILNFNPDSRVWPQSRNLRTRYESLFEFQWTMEDVMQFTLFKKIRNSLDKKVANGIENEDPWDMLYLKRAHLKHDDPKKPDPNSLTRLVLSTSEQDQTYQAGDLIQIKMYNKRSKTETKFFGHIKATVREVFKQQELFIDATICSTLFKDISVVAAYDVCSISHELITWLLLYKFKETQIVKNMLDPTTITSSAVLAQQLYPQYGSALSQQQAVIVSSFDNDVNTGLGISLVQAEPNAKKTATLIESVLQVFKTAKKSKVATPSVLICAKSDDAVEDLAMMLVELTKTMELKIVLNFEHESEELKPLTLRALAGIVPDPKAQADVTKNVIRSAAVVITKIERVHEMFVHSKQFDICFILEASQCSEIETIIPLCITTKKLALFGDIPDPLKIYVPTGGSSLFDRLCNGSVGNKVTPVMKLQNSIQIQP